MQKDNNVKSVIVVINNIEGDSNEAFIEGILVTGIDELIQFNVWPSDLQLGKKIFDLCKEVGCTRAVFNINEDIYQIYDGANMLCDAGIEVVFRDDIGSSHFFSHSIIRTIRG